MTGREHGAALEPLGNTPVVILVRPQLADNIGACARAMANGGLFHLRLVEPREGWPQFKAWRNSSGAHRILDEVKVFANVEFLAHVCPDCRRLCFRFRQRDEGVLRGPGGPPHPCSIQIH